MKRDNREIGPLAILLYPVIAIGEMGSALLRLVLGSCGEGNDYEYEY